MKEKPLIRFFRLVSALVTILAAGALIANCGGDESAKAIPHATTSTEDSYCLGCHQSGASGATVTPHPTRTGCTSCHKPQS
jgi:hypothetical protein